MSEKSFGRARNDVTLPRKPVITTDPRRAKRVRTYLKGRLVFGQGAFMVDCAICDISPTGARVRADPGLAISERVYLIHVRKWTAFESVVRWQRRDGSLGLKFQAMHDLNAPVRDDLKLLRQYCVDASVGRAAPLRS